MKEYNRPTWLALLTGLLGPLLLCSPLIVAMGIHWSCQL